MKKKLRLHQSVYGNVSQKINYKEEFLPDGEQETIDSKRNQFDKRAPQGSRLKNQGEVGDTIYQEDEEELEEGFLTPEDQLQVDLNRDELEDERMDSDSKVVTSNELEDANELEPLLDDEDEKELLYGMTEAKIKLYRKLKESIKRKSLYSEKEKFHRDSVIQLADQMSKYISKHEGNVNAVVNDITIGLFMAFSTYYKNDGDKETSGSDILKKVMKKLSSMITEYPELETGDLKDDFKLDDEELEDAGDLPSEDEEDVNLEEEDLTDDEILDEENEHEFHEEDEEEMEEATPKKPVKKKSVEKIDQNKINKLADHIAVKVEEEVDFPDYLAEKYDDDKEGQINELKKQIKLAKLEPFTDSEIKYFLNKFDVDYWGGVISELEDGNYEESSTDGSGSDSYNEDEEEELEEEMIGSSLSGESETQPQIRADLPQNMNPYKDRSGKYKKKEYTKVYR